MPDLVGLLLLRNKPWSVKAKENTMKRKLLILCLLILAVIIGVAGQRRPTPKAQTRISDLKINLNPLKSSFDRAIKCNAPRPKDIGCTTLCKPCITWRCQEGKWVEFELNTTDDAICEASPDLGDQTLSACPRGPEGFCAAECHICY